MTSWTWRLGTAAALVLAAWCWTAYAQQPFAGASSGAVLGSRELITHFLPSDGKPTALTIVDPAQRSIGVYHINRETGEIELKSVRNFAADLQMDGFNSNSLSPQEIRRGLERQP